VLVGAGPAAAQNAKDSKGGTLGGVLDTLGGILGAGSGKLHGSVVTARDTTLIVRTDDQRTVRVDTAAIDPQVRQQLVPGQMVSVTARGAGADVLAASDVQVEQGKTAPQKFQRVSGTVQERSEGRVLFRTRDGLTLPVDVSQIRGLPYMANNTPATLIYQQGPQQQIQAVWIEPGDASASASPTTEPAASTPAPAPAASPGGQTLQGMVESVGLSDLTVQTADGKHVTVGTSSVDKTALASVRPGDSVTITGTPGADATHFTATSVTRAK
jgi:preprotein translocase subunit YajC